MRYFCTLFNKNYIYQAHCLFLSLQKHQKEFKLFCFCADDESMEYFKNINSPSLEVLGFQQLEDSLPLLQTARQNRSMIEYFFTCTPAICLYVMKHYPGVDEIVYLDADLFFFDSPEIVFDEIGNSSVSIIPHRFNFFNKLKGLYGHYNVGWVSFKKTEEGLACLNKWHTDCLDWCYDKLSLKRYADQKYLNYWPKLYKNISIIKNIGANAGPWNIGNYTVSKKNGKVFLNKTSLVFFHFASLKHIDDSYYTTCSLYYHKLNKTIKDEIYLVYLKHLHSIGYIPVASPRLKKGNFRSIIRKAIRYLFNDTVRMEEIQKKILIADASLAKTA